MSTPLLGAEVKHWQIGGSEYVLKKEKLKSVKEYQSKNT